MILGELELASYISKCRPTDCQTYKLLCSFEAIRHELEKKGAFLSLLRRL